MKTYMKDKTAKLEIRISPEEKQQIKDYCEKYNLSMSEFIRDACNKIFSQEVE